jgi:hypothetical protein
MKHNDAERQAKMREDRVEDETTCEDEKTSTDERTGTDERRKGREGWKYHSLHVFIPRSLRILRLEVLQRKTKQRLAADRYERTLPCNQQKKAFLLFYDSRVVLFVIGNPIKTSLFVKVSTEAKGKFRPYLTERVAESLLCQSLLLLLNRLLGRELDSLVQQDQCRVTLATTGQCLDLVGFDFADLVVVEPPPLAVVLANSAVSILTASLLDV